MATQEFYIDYFDKKYLNSQFLDRENKPHFQLADGNVGGDMWLGGDPHETPSPSYHVVSRPNDFIVLTLDVLQFLRKPTSLRNSYQTKLSEPAFAQIGENGKRVLDEILALHNDFVTPRRS